MSEVDFSEPEPDVDGYLEECRRLDQEGPDPDEPGYEPDEPCPECDNLGAVPDGEDGQVCPTCHALPAGTPIRPPKEEQWA